MLAAGDPAKLWGLTSQLLTDEEGALLSDAHGPSGLSYHLQLKSYQDNLLEAPIETITKVRVAYFWLLSNRISSKMIPFEIQKLRSGS